MQIDTKELSIVKGQVSKAILAADSLIVRSEIQYREAGELLKKIKTVGKLIKQKKESITKPISEALKNVRSMFAPLEDNYELAEKTVSDKIIFYQDQVEAKRHEEELKAQKELEEAQKKLAQGKITEKQAEKIEAKVEKKLEKAPEVIKKTDDFHTRVNKKVRIVDESLIPREYLMVDEVKVRRAVLGGVDVPGAELYEEKTLV